MEMVNSGIKNTFLNPLKKLVVTIILLFAGAIIGYFFAGQISTTKYVTQIKETPNNQQASQNIWAKPISHRKGYPVLDKAVGKENTMELSIYSLADKKTTRVVYTVGRGGTSGLGNTNPLASPDLLYTAFISKDLGNLTIVSNDTLITRDVPDVFNVSDLSAWSPDSKKLIYYIAEDSITERTFGPGGPLGKVKFDPNLNSGFFVFDIDSGKNKKLYPVSYFESFIDNSRILVRTTDQYSKDNLIIFNIDTFEADYEAVKEKFGYGADQFSLSNDGSRWSYTLSRNPTNDGNIIYAPFPNKEGEQIDSGDWAEIQFSKISPSGEKVAYSKRDGFFEPNFPKYSVFVYDAKTKQKTKYNVEGWVATWIDEDTLIATSSDASKTNDYLYLLDLKTGNTNKLK